MSENAESSSSVSMPQPVANLFRTVIERSSALLGVAVIIAILSAIASFIDVSYLIENLRKLYVDGDKFIYALLVGVLNLIVWYFLGYGLSLVASLKTQTVIAVAGAVGVLAFLQILILDLADPSDALIWLFRVAAAGAVAFLFSEFNNVIPADGETRFDQNWTIIVAVGLVVISFLVSEFQESLFNDADSEGDLRLYAVIVGLINGAAIAAFLVYAFMQRVKQGSSAA